MNVFYGLDKYVLYPSPGYIVELPVSTVESKVGVSSAMVYWLDTRSSLLLHLVVTRDVSLHDLTLVPCIPTVPNPPCSFHGKAHFNDNDSDSNGGAVLNQFGSLT